MPMRWTPENDRILLLKILEAHAVSVNYNAIAASWPAEHNEKPTARAISERIFKLKQMAGKQDSAATAPSTPAASTPRSRGSARSRGGPRTASVRTAPKRKLDIEDDRDGETQTKTKRVKKESEEVTLADLTALEAATPSKRNRKPVEHLNMAAYPDSGTDSNDHSFGSVDADFVPDEAPTFCSADPQMDVFSDA